MEYNYLKGFDKSAADDISTVQAVIAETGAAIDTKLFPLIEEAEKGDFETMLEVYEMFAFGNHGVKPNYQMALRYCHKLHQVGLDKEDSELISIGLNNLAIVHHNFGQEEKAHTGFLEAFRFMVANLEPEQWDKQIFNLVAEYVNSLEQD